MTSELNKYLITGISYKVRFLIPTDRSERVFKVVDQYRGAKMAKNLLANTHAETSVLPLDCEYVLHFFEKKNHDGKIEHPLRIFKQIKLKGDEQQDPIEKNPENYNVWMHYGGPIY